MYNLKYVIGIDGGGTKTICAVASIDGSVLEIQKTGCTNPYISGIEQAKIFIADAIEMLIKKLGVSVRDIDNVHMGLAGADNKSDIELLQEAFNSTILKKIPYQIQNDIWIAYKARSLESVGAVSVCGTGHNTGVLAYNNRKICINAYRYPLGNFGGGRMITDMAVNDAYRSYEYTGDKTMLEDELYKYCGYNSLKQFAQDIMRSGYVLQYKFSVPKLVIELAKKGDVVSQRILQTIGCEQGRMTGGLIKKAGLCDIQLPIVLSGTIYVTDKSGFLLNSYENSVKQLCPAAIIQLLDREPVQGALINAIEQCKQELSNKELFKISEKINETMNIIYTKTREV